MNKVFFHLNVFSLLKILFSNYIFNNNNHFHYIYKTYSAKQILKIFNFLKLKITKIDWDFNELRHNSMLLGYKIEIDDLNFFTDFFINCYTSNNDRFLKTYIRKELKTYKIFKNISLYEFLFTCVVLKKRFDNFILYIPKTFHSKSLRLYFKEKYDVKIIANYGHFNFLFIKIFDIFKNQYFIRSIYYKLKNQLKYFKNYFLYKNYTNINIKNKKNIISFEVALNAFKPQNIFNNTNINNLFLINKIHKLSNFDIKNLKQSKKKFIPLYNYNIHKNNINSNLKYYLLKKYNLSLNDEFNYKFFNEFLFWYNYFKISKTKIYLTNYKYSSHIVPASLAMSELNGVSAMFQTSFTEKASPYSIFNSDIYFSFSNNFHLPEKIIGSQFDYNISVGYTYDYKFEIAKKNSIKIRNNLQINGAKIILSFFDQGSIADNKLTAGFYHTRDSYAFILNKLIANEWLGLIIKPKKPSQLKQSLGPIYELLLKALNTKRCHIYLNSDEINAKNFENPPAEAAYASDVAIHNCLVAGTAGIEGAIVGNNTLFFDYFGFEESIFYKYKDEIVFNKWENLWKYFINNYSNNEFNKINRWNDIIDKIDPFRDGKSMYRIEEFTNNLLKASNLYDNKNLIVKYAVDIYKNKWGSDKVLKI